MAGTVPSLSLSTQFDKNGELLRSGKIYWYQANTLTPQLAYADSGLTVALPNPYTLDGSARVPEFYCADGSIRVRVVDKNGLVQIDAKSVLVIGPSSGGGGGGSVDATAILQTGDVLWLDQSGARAGFVRDNGRTIGSVTSGASERANADCQPLFLFGWALGNARGWLAGDWQVSGGFGANAAADWAADKQLILPDKRGFVSGGLDDMGNAAAGRFASVPVIAGAVTTPGSRLGEAVNTLDITKIPSHGHGVTDNGHTHGERGDGGGGIGNRIVLGLGDGSNSPASVLTTSSSTTGITINNAGGGGSHNNTPLTVLGTFYRKL